MDQKEQFIQEMLQNKKPFKHLCAEFGISEKTGYKWKNRFLEEGKIGLNELSRMPRNSPNSLPEDVVIAIINLRHAHPAWGAKKILALYEKGRHADIPSLSSVKRVLDKAHLVKKRKVRKVETNSSRLCRRILPEAANDV